MSRIICKYLVDVVLILLTIISFLRCQSPLSKEEKLRFKQAIIEKDTDYIKRILDRKININSERTFSYVPLHIAVSTNDIDIIKLFLEYGADINAVNGVEENCLFRTYDIEVVKFLIKNGANVNQKNYLGLIPLNHFLWYLDLVKIYVENGSNINNIDEFGWPLLFHALMDDNIEIVKYLIEKGINVKVKDKQGMNALIFHSFNGYNTRIVDVLLENGIDINAESDSGVNALIESVLPPLKFKKNKFKKKYAYITHLIQKGIDVNHQDKLGNTALHYAVLREKPVELIALLLKHGSQKDIRNNEGKTPLDIAIEKGNSRIIMMLKR